MSVISLINLVTELRVNGKKTLGLLKLGEFFPSESEVIFISSRRREMVFWYITKDRSLKPFKLLHQPFWASSVRMSATSRRQSNLRFSKPSSLFDYRYNGNKVPCLQKGGERGVI